MPFAINELLNGEKSAFRNIVLFGASAALYIAGTTNNLSEGFDIAGSAIDSGNAAMALQKLIEITNSP